MPVTDYKTYCTILDRARAGGIALPAINVTSLTTANAALRGLTESDADGIIQISTGGGAFASGTSVKDSALGAISTAFAEYFLRLIGNENPKTVHYVAAGAIFVVAVFIVPVFWPF